MSEHKEGNTPEGSQSQETRHAPDVKPKPTPKESNSKEEHGKKKRRAHMRRSRSTDFDRVERGRRRDRSEKRQRGRSEDARRPDTREQDGNWEKVKPPENDLEDRSCPICLSTYDNVFKTPKLLACRHTFCLECLARINVTSPTLKTLSCPICRRLTKLPHGRDLPRLKNNQDILCKLPLEMWRALSISFRRSKGKLLLKNPPTSHLLTPATKARGGQVTASGHLNTTEQDIVRITVVDVGKPPNRVKGVLLRFFMPDLFCTGDITTIIVHTATVITIMLLGILSLMMLLCALGLLYSDQCY